LSALIVSARLGGKEPSLPPPTTAHGGLLAHLSRETKDYQPSNITFAHLPPLEGMNRPRMAE
jgi:methylenetetrahydrofolate--tRNA-(uracil-5-)-methyltransferase